MSAHAPDSFKTSPPDVAVATTSTAPGAPPAGAPDSAPPAGDAPAFSVAAWIMLAVTVASIGAAVWVCAPYGHVPAVAWVWGFILTGIVAIFGAVLLAVDVNSER